MELCAAVASLLLLGIAIAPLMASSNSDSKRLGCYSNLRQIGIAAQTWGDDHQDQLPWRTFVSEGGSKPNSAYKLAAAWADFIVLSNRLASPRVLVCPADGTAKAAANFSNGTMGFANPSFRANALSYFISYHADPAYPRSVVTGDRDFTTSGPDGTCSFGYVQSTYSVRTPETSVVWTNSVHQSAGHLLGMDGAVEFVPSSELGNALLSTQASDTGRLHLTPAR